MKVFETCKAFVFLCLCSLILRFKRVLAISFYVCSYFGYSVFCLLFVVFVAMRWLRWLTRYGFFQMYRGGQFFVYFELLCFVTVAR